MLDLMRRNARSWVIKAALAGVAITFIFMYGAPSRTPQSDRNLAEIDGDVITGQELDTAYRRKMDELRQQFQGAIPPGLDTKIVRKKVLLDMVYEKLVSQEAARLGLFITDKDLARSIKSDPNFQQDGKFSEQQYRALLSSVRLTPGEYEARRKKEMLYDQVARILTDGLRQTRKKPRNAGTFKMTRFGSPIC